MPSPAALFAYILFGFIGLGLLSYGKKMASWKPLAAGFALIAYPYFVDGAWALYGIGVGICALLYAFRD